MKKILLLTAFLLVFSLNNVNAAVVFNDSFNYSTFNTTRWNDISSAFITLSGGRQYADAGIGAWLSTCTNKPLNSSGNITITFLADMGNSFLVYWYRDINTPDVSIGEHADTAYIFQSLPPSGSQIYTITGGSPTFEASGGTFSISGWHNITIESSLSANLINIYEDGVLQLSATPVSPITPNEANWTACWGGGMAEFTFDEVSITDLTPDAPAPDVAAPSFNKQQPTNGRNFSSGSSVTISANWSDAVALASFIFESNVTGSLANITVTASGSSNFSNYTFIGLATGAYKWRIYANDSSGNMNSTPQRDFSIDAAPDVTKPQFTKQQPTNGVQYDGGSLVTISASWTDNVALASFIFESNVTGSLANITVTASGSSNFSNYTFYSLPDGYYKWRIYATDSSGNMNVTPQQDFSVVTSSESGQGNFVIPLYNFFSSTLGLATGVVVAASQPNTYGLLTLAIFAIVGVYLYRRFVK